MPRKLTMAYREVATLITDPITKFGGQPICLGEPRWPLSRQYGTPMQFICQIALTAELFGSVGNGGVDADSPDEPRMAYLFATDDFAHGYLAATWGPNDGENALLLEPGGTWEGPTVPLCEGPSLYRHRWTGVRWNPHTGTGWERTPCEFAVELRPGDDPEAGAWDDVDSDDTAAWDAYMGTLLEDKIGGTPVPTINEPSFPDPTHWRLLWQFNTKVNEAEDPYFLNFASDGVGYAFLSKDGRLGHFLWSR